MTFVRIPVIVESEKESKLSPEELCRKADAGDVNAQLDAGYMYLYGVDGEKVDYGKALHYYTLAAQQKNAAALNNLGSLYFNGLGTPVNYKKAIQYFDEATQLGSNDAAVNLAIIYMGSVMRANSGASSEAFQFTLEFKFIGM